MSTTDIRTFRREIETRLKVRPPRTDDGRSAASFLLASLLNVEATPGEPVLLSFLQQDLDAFERAMEAERGPYMGGQ